MDGPAVTRPTVNSAAMSLWQLERRGPGWYHGWCHDGAWRRAFGGQVAAQALAAAAAELGEDRWPTSLLAYFLREGRSSEPIEYVVHAATDEDAAARYLRVTASQSGKPILILQTAFAPGPSAQRALTSAPPMDPPGDLWTPDGPGEERWLAEQRRRLRFEVRFADRPSRLAGQKGEVAFGQRFWIRTGQRLPDAHVQHACAVTYASDLFLVSTALARHGLPAHRTDIEAASLDLGVWFHRPVRADEWLLYEQSSPTAAGGRGLSAGRIVDLAGNLVATIRQEVLLRLTQ